MWLLLALTFTAFADKYAYPPQKLNAAGVTEIRVSGVKGRLVMKGRPGKFYRIKVTHSKGKKFEDWNLSVDRQGGALVLEVFNVAFGAQWRHQVREELWPEFDIEIEGPSQPAVVGWRDGGLQFDKWRSPIEAAFLNGTLQSSGGAGDLKIQAVDARVAITGHQGAIHLKGEKGRVELKQIKGSADVTWMEGVFRAANFSGELRLDLNAGHAKLDNVAAVLKGKGGSSEWEVSASAPGDLEVVTDSGPVRIKWLSGGAKLFLSSQQGSIRVPKPFQIESREGVKVVEGTKPAALKGSVFVRTQTGNISWQ